MKCDPREVSAKSLIDLLREFGIFEGHVTQFAGELFEHLDGSKQT